MKSASGKERLTWDSQVVMKPVEEIARELAADGWHLFWKSEVEAIATKDKASEAGDMDIVELIESLGIKLKKVGKEYMGLCPFHDDHRASLSVNKEKGLWHCFGCGKSGTIHDFAEAYRRSRFME